MFLKQRLATSIHLKIINEHWNEGEAEGTQNTAPSETPISLVAIFADTQQHSKTQKT